MLTHTGTHTLYTHAHALSLSLYPSILLSHSLTLSVHVFNNVWSSLPTVVYVKWFIPYPEPLKSEAWCLPAIFLADCVTGRFTRR